jgi:hypothetical protein
VSGSLDALRDVNEFVMGTRRTVLLSVVGVMVATAYGLFLYAITEPWRVYSNDYLGVGYCERGTEGNIQARVLRHKGHDR